MLRYAFYPGCVAKGTCPELYHSTLKLAEKLEIGLEEMKDAACCGAGVIDGQYPEFSDTLNARTFAIAEEMGLEIMTICSTCQGAMRKANRKLVEGNGYRGEINEALRGGDRQYNGAAEIKHLLWILRDDYGLERLKEKVVRPLKGLRVASFYGCHILRPSVDLGFDDPERPRSMDDIVEALGGEPVDYRGKTKCCGFPILLENQRASLDMTADQTLDAKENGAECMVTPCPLCHLSLDIYQGKAASQRKTRIDLPILHLSQLVGMAVGLTPDEMGMPRHFVSTRKLTDKVYA